MRKRMHTSDDVQRGVDRFMEDFRSAFCYDAESELVEPCKNGCGYPAALHSLCFTCLAAQSRCMPS